MFALIFDGFPKVVKINKERVETTDYVKDLRDKLSKSLDKIYDEILIEIDKSIHSMIRKGDSQVCVRVIDKLHSKVCNHLKDLGLKTDSWSRTVQITIPEGDIHKYSIRD